MVTPEFNQARLKWDLRRGTQEAKYEAFWGKRSPGFPAQDYFSHPHISLEIGAGTGSFFTLLAKLYPDRFFVAIERCRLRGRRLVRKTKKAGFCNLVGLRGNAIPALISGINDASVERIYILYPCPWPKNSQRKHRWHLHPVMRHLIRVLKPGGLMLWTSDQTFYIDEAHYVCEREFGLQTLIHGPLAPNEFNDLNAFPEGRTKFEKTFRLEHRHAYELIVRKNSTL